VIPDDERVPCAICGELHEPNLIERFFIAECDRRGLAWQPGVIPVVAQQVAALTSLMVAPIGMSLDDKPGLLPYFAATLVAVSKVADTQAEQVVAAECADDIPESWR